MLVVLASFTSGSLYIIASEQPAPPPLEGNRRRPHEALFMNMFQTSPVACTGEKATTARSVSCVSLFAISGCKVKFSKLTFRLLILQAN